MRTADNPARLPPHLRDKIPPGVEGQAADDVKEAISQLDPVPKSPFEDGAEDVGTMSSGPDETPQPTWEPIETAPRDGRDVHVRWGEDDEQGRVVRWHNGRRFYNRRWHVGGSWKPSDEMTPLPADEPTEWLRMDCPHDWLTVPREGNLAKCPKCGVIQNLMHVSKSSGKVELFCSDPVWPRPEDEAA